MPKEKGKNKSSSLFWAVFSSDLGQISMTALNTVYSIQNNNYFSFSYSDTPKKLDFVSYQAKTKSEPYCVNYKKLTF